MVNKTGWESVIEALKTENVEYVYGLVGGGIDFWDELDKDGSMKPIHVRHEASATFMAYAHGRLTGEPGIVFTSPGPGAAYMFPGFLEAWSACIPMISPAPCPPLAHDGKGVLQEADMIGAFKTVTKWSFKVPVVENIPWAMQRAFSLAVNGRPGPVYLEIPMDVGPQKKNMPEYKPSVRPLKTRGDHDKINEAINLILKSERPVIVAGGGVILSRAFNELKEFSEYLGIPVATTASGRGSIPEDHPLSIGLTGLYRTKIGKEFYQSADLVISIGSQFEELETQAWNMYPHNAKFLEINIDSFEMGRNIMPDVAVVGDAKLILADLLCGIKEKLAHGRLDSDRVKNLIKAKKDYEALIDEECTDLSKPTKTRKVIRALSKLFGNNTILCNENGMSDLWSYMCPYYKVLDVNDCIPPAEQTAMGLGVVGAIAAKMLLPEKNVLCVSGDGAFQMFMKEMPTAVQYGAPVTWAIMNNGALNWSKYVQKYWFGGPVAVDFTVAPDYVKIAEANQCYGERIENPNDVEQAIENALQANKEGIPAALDFVIDPEDRSEFFEEYHRLGFGSPK